ncbi:MAG: hypothetical protein WCF18_17590 [Chthoniobacteraceae bacterium]
MKPLFILGVLFASIVAPLHAADTAYSALRVYGKKEGEQALYRVVELRGKAGTPQPTSWKLTIDEPRARGGVREIEVRGGRITGERTPVGRDFGAPMNFTQLNLDSDGVFTVANQEAEKRGIAFDRLDYTLHSGSGGGAPIWTVELFEGRNGRVGTLRIAADSGAIVEQNFSSDRRYEGDRAFVENDRRSAPDRDRRTPEYHNGNEPGQEIGDFFNRVGRHFQKRGRQLSNFFTGKDSDR